MFPLQFLIFISCSGVPGAPQAARGAGEVQPAGGARQVRGRAGGDRGRAARAGARGQEDALPHRGAAAHEGTRHTHDTHQQ